MSGPPSSVIHDAPGTLRRRVLQSFENWVVVELSKARLNLGEEARLSFWRDNVGQEIDVVREHGDRLDAWECKSGMTYVPEWTAALEKWRDLAGRKAGVLHLAYGGRESFTRGGIAVTSWTDIGVKAS